MKKSVFLSIILIFSTCSILMGKEVADVDTTPYLDFSPQSEMRSSMNLAMQQQNNEEDSSLVALHNHPDYILPKKALFFSVLIPGAGELYTKSYLKAALFFGIEVGAWTMYAIYNKKGNEKEDEFEAYANEYWDEDKWRAWYDNLTPEEQGVFSHSLPDTKTQQYYEMIGKYNQFLVGWKGVEKNLTSSQIHEEQFDSDLRQDYMDMRYDSNNMFKRANNGAYIAMFNHVLSAIDAAWTAKNHNKKLVQTSLRFENKYFNNHDHTMLSLKLRW